MLLTEPVLRTLVPLRSRVRSPLEPITGPFTGEARSLVLKVESVLGVLEVLRMELVDVRTRMESGSMEVPTVNRW